MIIMLLYENKYFVEKIEIIKNMLKDLTVSLKHIFSLSLSKGIFADELKIAKVTPIFKTGERSSLSNYRPISVLPCFYINIRKHYVQEVVSISHK